jgi:hypothetical protein
MGIFDVQSLQIADYVGLPRSSARRKSLNESRAKSGIGEKTTAACAS